MRLLDTHNVKIKEVRDDEIPPYAILSHTWDEEEVIFQDMEGNCEKDKKGYEKVQNCCSVAEANGFDYAWMDTCCIDKTSSAELSEAINSMFYWYQQAEECYAYLADVPSDIDGQADGNNLDFSKSRWFTRGWTLQELIAPSTVVFLNKSWIKIGDKSSLRKPISKVTRIPEDILLGHDFESSSIAQRMSWATKRQTTKVEDRAYCLMGIFGINMPLLYGEGERAFVRLQEEIMKISDDHSLFAWRSIDNRGGLLATSPDAFVNCDKIVPSNRFNLYNGPLTVSNKGIHLTLPFIGLGRRGGHRALGLAILHCAEIGKIDHLVAIYLTDSFLTMEHFERVQTEEFKLLDLTEFNPPQYPERRICVKQGRLARIQKSKDPGNYPVTPLKVEQSIGPEEVHLQLNRKQFDGELIDLLDSGKRKLLLLRAAEEGYVEIIQQLVDRSDMETNLKDDDGLTSLSHAARGGHEAVVKLLLTRNDVEADSTDTKRRTPLSHAAGGGHEAVVKLLLTRSDVKADSTDTEGRTPLLHAAAGGHEEVIWLLLTRSDVKADSRDTEGRKILSHAARGGHKAVVKILLTRSDVEAYLIDNNGRTSLSDAAQNGHEAVVKLLLETGRVDVDSKDRSGWTPLSWAAQNGHEAVVKLLLEAGRVDVDSKDRFGRTPLAWAAQNGHKAVVKLLLETGRMDVNSKDRSSRTPLSWAAQNGHEAVAKLLLETGRVDVDSKDDYGQTPLSWAVQNVRKTVVKLLLGTDKVDVNSKDNYDQTPLSRAVEQGHEAVVKLLQSFIAT